MPVVHAIEVENLLLLKGTALWQRHALSLHEQAWFSHPQLAWCSHMRLLDAKDDVLLLSSVKVLVL